MTTETTVASTVSTGFITLDIDAHKKACAYLKGFIVGQLPKWSGKVTTPEFERGMKETNFAAVDYHDGHTTFHLSAITYVHILHNRIRHRRPHLGSEEKDMAFLKAFRKGAKEIWWLATRANQIDAVLSEYGVDTDLLAGGAE
jgi:hypothetical protein